MRNLSLLRALKLRQFGWSHDELSKIGLSDENLDKIKKFESGDHRYVSEDIKDKLRTQKRRFIVQNVKYIDIGIDEFEEKRVYPLEKTQKLEFKRIYNISTIYSAKRHRYSERDRCPFCGVSVVPSYFGRTLCSRCWNTLKQEAERTTTKNRTE